MRFTRVSVGPELVAGESVTVHLIVDTEHTSGVPVAIVRVPAAAIDLVLDALNASVE